MDNLNSMAEILGYKVSSIPFSYLGSTLDQIIAESPNGLKSIAHMDDKKIFMGGRITLLNSVLSSIPIYYLSFYSIPTFWNEDWTGEGLLREKFATFP
ncbi:hypothetical protein ACS0TY_010189 [Phlomoides rotata]